MPSNFGYKPRDSQAYIYILKFPKIMLSARCQPGFAFCAHCVLSVASASQGSNNCLGRVILPKKGTPLRGKGNRYKKESTNGMIYFYGFCSVVFSTLNVSHIPCHPQHAAQNTTAVVTRMRRCEGTAATGVGGGLRTHDVEGANGGGDGIQRILNPPHKGPSVAHFFGLGFRGGLLFGQQSTLFYLFLFSFV